MFSSHLRLCKSLNYMPTIFYLKHPDNSSTVSLKSSMNFQMSLLENPNGIWTRSPRGNFKFMNIQGCFENTSPTKVSSHPLFWRFCRWVGSFTHLIRFSPFLAWIETPLWGVEGVSGSFWGELFHSDWAHLEHLGLQSICCPWKSVITYNSRLASSGLSIDQ